MRITSISISNFKSIRKLTIEDIDSAMIVVGKNSTGKTSILDAILLATGVCELQLEDFSDPEHNIEIGLTFEITEKDLVLWNEKGIVSKYKRFSIWLKEFNNKLPSYQEGKMSYTYIANRNSRIRFYDGFRKHNPNIREILPKIYYIDHTRSLKEMEQAIFMMQGHRSFEGLRENICIFDKAKHCINCFQCIGVIHKKEPALLTIQETTKLLEYKLFQLNMDSFMSKLNMHFMKNSERDQRIVYRAGLNVDELFKMETMLENHERETVGAINTMSAGTKSIYLLSLLETYIEENESIPCIIMVEDPEIYLHPQLQKVSSEILYRLSKKNQVIFSTHSPNLIFNFNSKQIKQTVLDDDFYTTINKNATIDAVLNDLGYSANDLLNVSFVFIVEGKQDKNRLPLLLKKHYGEIYNEKGLLQRIAIIATNSCTNIKTYANLKYMNQLYLKDQFLMIRDGDGKDAITLQIQLCKYYKQRAEADQWDIPRVQPRNVLILKYYSFENYFLDPKIMAKIKVIDSEEAFYQILFDKFKEYLYKLKSVKNMMEQTGVEIHTIEDVKNHMEEIKTYVRGHNLFDIFYGRYKGELENQILKAYIEVAPKETFQDILDAIDSFIFFENKKLPQEES